MRIIPVLDLKAGQVVRAQQGRRDSYRPIETPLSGSADPVAVARGLRVLHPFSTFYIADIDAIEGRSPNDEAVALLAAMPEAPELWLDAGFSDESQLAAMLARPSFHAVLGSESQRDTAILCRFKGHPRLILSLDFFQDGFRGARSLLEEPDLWPETVIVMTLARVGAASGPDFSTLAEIKAKAGGRMLVAAGGIRDEADIRELAALGIAAALVSTSLHNGSLTAETIAALARA
ncbi:nickel transporter [Pseudaminobacter arsenicus]|uniref:Nickel transporter n=1 Tax=Borborobacter arsenicus TaxID=1851146 RepID=A0A432V431_9HYPH|nr:HisA/HisF-related TIM barrel protein [Pseudaminobacter arsenicus]RUM96888.1 nickel transporter [Pseudaminobacter arsenicus]